MSTLADATALARKDLLLELRARETLPAMLLFVLSALVIFHFALPGGTSRLAASGLLWVAIVFTALLGLTRAFAPEREGGTIDGLVLAPCDRAAIWLAKSIATLDHLPHRGDPGRAEQLLQLGQMVVVAGGNGGDHQGTLARPPSLTLAILTRRLVSVMCGSALAQRQ